jgi:hypothetical protein
MPKEPRGGKREIRPSRLDAGGILRNGSSVARIQSGDSQRVLIMIRLNDDGDDDDDDDDKAPSSEGTT